MYFNKNSKIFIAGHKGMVGSALVNFLKKKGYKRIFTVDRSILDLTDKIQTEKYLKK